MFSSIRVIVFLSVALLCVGCDTGLVDLQSDLEFIIEGSQSNNTIKRNIVIDNQLDFENAYLSDLGNQNSNIPVPQIDFTQRLVIAIFLGQQSTGGYSITIAKIVETDNEYQALLSIAGPGPGCIVTQEVSTPYTMYSIPITEKEIVFMENWTTSACI